MVTDTTVIDDRDKDDEERQVLSALSKTSESALEAQQQALQMLKDGYTTEQIANALGYDIRVIENFTQQTVEVGSPEEVLQESLRCILSLIPIAEAQYRERPAATFAYTLTGFIESARTLIAQMYDLKGKESVYRNIVSKVLQPFCREMIKAMISEVSLLNQDIGSIEGITEADLKNFSTNLGKKFNESYRKSTEDLGNALGVASDVRSRILSGVPADG